MLKETQSENSFCFTGTDAVLLELFRIQKYSLTKERLFKNCLNFNFLQSFCFPHEKIELLNLVRLSD